MNGRNPAAGGVQGAARGATPASFTAAVVTKGTINLRIEVGIRRLIDDAAVVLGKTRTEFMVGSARRQAIDVLLDQRLSASDSHHHDAFMHVLDNPAAPGPKLRCLPRRGPAWQGQAMCRNALDLIFRGSIALNDWLRRRALKNGSCFSRTYVVRRGSRVVVYF